MICKPGKTICGGTFRILGAIREVEAGPNLIVALQVLKSVKNLKPGDVTLASYSGAESELYMFVKIDVAWYHKVAVRNFGNNLKYMKQNKYIGIKKNENVDLDKLKIYK